MKKVLVLLGFMLGLGCPALYAQTGGDISTILEDNALREAATRYMSILVFFQPEEATRLGFTAGNATLNDRSPQTDTEALQAFESVQKQLQQLNVKNLSATNQADYQLLDDALTRHQWQLQQNRLTTDPLYYAQALDAVYDLLLQPAATARKQRTDLLGRVTALPKVAEQAQQNLTTVNPHLARLAMEKTYYAFISFDTIAQQITEGGNLTNDFRDANQLEADLQKARNSIRQLFELFKQFAQQTDTQLFLPLTPDAYAQKLNAYYQLSTKPAQLDEQLKTAWDAAQHTLFAALQPFELSADDEEVTVEDLNERPQAKQPAAKTPAAQPVYTPPTANQFEAVAGQLASPFGLDDLLTQFTQEANRLGAFFITNKVLSAPLTLRTQELMPYFAYQAPYITRPALADFFLRLPQGNEQAKEQALKRDFNEPATRVLISQAIIPGRYYQAQQTKSNIRRLLGSPLLANGWTLYALQAAQQHGWFITDEELLFAAWQRFVRALLALVDYRLYTQQYTYEQAMTFLTEENGFSTEAATQLLAQVLQQPGEAVSYVVGAQLWQDVADKYAHKATPSAAALLVKVGNVSPKDLNAEVKRLYKQK